MKISIVLASLLAAAACDSTITDSTELNAKGSGKGGNGGGNGGDGGDDRGSAAWFAEEAVEYAVRGASSDSPSAVTFELTGDNAAQVTIATASGDTSGQCLMVDEWSHSGTVLKKDVVCIGLGVEAEKAARGSDAWALEEGVEHSLMQLSPASVELVAASLSGEDRVDVSIVADGAERSFLCLRTERLRNGAVKYDLVCLNQ